MNNPSGVKLVTAFILVAGVVACGSSSSSGGSVHVSSACPMSFNPGAPGARPPDGGISTAPPSTCEALPAECTSDPTCDCLACHSACGACFGDGGVYSDGGGGGATCSYDPASGTFSVTCINA